MTDELLAVERRGATGWIIFNQPESRNALTLSMYDQLGEACRELGEDPDIRVIGLRGAGTEAFAAGTDILDLRGIDSGTAGLAYEAKVEAALEQLESVPKPTIALLLGATAGGGAAIALACDMRIAGENLRFGVPIARTVGNILSGHNLSRLLEMAGPALTFDLIYTGRLVSAEEALRTGLVNRVVPVREAEEQAEDLSRTISQNAPLTLQLSKRMVTRFRSKQRAQMNDPTNDELIEVVYSSDDFREGLAAFIEHRSPHWIGG